jgi:hypothetical protein
MEIVYVTWAGRVRGARTRTRIFLRWRFHTAALIVKADRACSTYIYRHYTAEPFRAWERGVFQRRERSGALVGAVKLARGREAAAASRRVFGAWCIVAVVGRCRLPLSNPR